MSEDTEPHRDDVTVAWTVLAPSSPDAPTERDRVVLLGAEYEVHGRPADYTHGPWPNSMAGIVVELVEVTG